MRVQLALPRWLAEWLRAQGPSMPATIGRILADAYAAQATARGAQLLATLRWDDATDDDAEDAEDAPATGP